MVSILQFIRRSIRALPSLGSAPVFYGCALIAVVIRLIMTSDMGVHTIYAPHDDLLYVLRAYYLLTDWTLGQYDARTLVKLPGFSFFLAGIRLLGLPYLLTILLLYSAAGLYCLAVLRRAGVPAGVLLGAFVLYVFNPVTYDEQSFRVMREPLSIVLVVTILGAMGHLLHHAQNGRGAWLHTLILAIGCAFLMLVREEDVIFYVVLVLFGVILTVFAKERLDAIRALKLTALTLGVTLAVILAGNGAMRLFVMDRYGAPILHDFGAGEFPKLLAAMRSIETAKDNRLVMPTQETLLKLREAVPELVPLIDKLPRPGLGTYSCERFKVCSEWTSGYMYFWIKDAAFASGHTPDLASAQEYYRHIRLEIERACHEGRLHCRPTGTGMFPPFELRWTRAFVHEGRKAMGMMWHPPFTDPGFPQDAPVDDQTAKLYKAITMTPYDAPLPTIIGGSNNGVTAKTNPYQSPLNGMKYAVEWCFSAFGGLTLIAGLTGFLYLLLIARHRDSRILLGIAGIATFYALIRLLALAYVSIYMGFLDPRMYFSTYVVAMLLALPLIVVAGRQYLATRKLSKTEGIYA